MVSCEWQHRMINSFKIDDGTKGTKDNIIAVSIIIYMPFKLEDIILCKSIRNMTV